MKFNVENAPKLPDEGVAVGNIYNSHNHRVTRYWMVVAVRENTVVCLGLNEAGEITQTTSYARHVFDGGCCWAGRKRIGKCKDLDLTFNIEWETLP